MTIPRLTSLASAYRRRRGRELHELAAVAHAPEEIRKVYPLGGDPLSEDDVAPVATTAHAARPQWWKSGP